jgi:hypothetical protein
LDRKKEINIMSKFYIGLTTDGTPYAGVIAQYDHGAVLVHDAIQSEDISLVLEHLKKRLKEYDKHWILAVQQAGGLYAGEGIIGHYDGRENDALRRTLNNVCPILWTRNQPLKPQRRAATLQLLREYVDSGDETRLRIHPRCSEHAAGLTTADEPLFEALGLALVEIEDNRIGDHKFKVERNLNW